MELRDFQSKASEEIAKRYSDYIKAPLSVEKNVNVPFYQNLASLTGSGKTLILCDCIEQIRAFSSIEPIVLWLSKGRVVVSQTLDKLSNGDYSDNIPNFMVKPLLDCKANDILDDERGLVLIATVGKINQKDKEEGDRRVFQTGFDKANSSLWEMLKKRTNREGTKRDLIIVYDEGHNLSDQQTKILLDLLPDALLAASATTKVPKELEWTIVRLKKDKRYKDSDLIYTVSNKEVVDSELIKKHIAIGGYMTPMEIAIDNLLNDMKATEEAATKYACDFLPKAIYVSDTNMLLATSEVDEPAVPFSERKARPIQIWRHLVSRGVPPTEIAIYCKLKFHKNYPKPNEFNLFSGGDNDYDEFIKGNYRHIIFNQSLQEGWDDPACYFAYIDKDMGSNTQVTQVIGRVLRQPCTSHFPDDRLNLASYYIKTDEKDVIRNIIDEVRRTLTIDIPETSISYHISKVKSNNRPMVKPKVSVSVPDVAVVSSKAMPEIKTILDKMIDYSEDATNTVGPGSTIKVVAEIGSNEAGDEISAETKHSNKVTARWVFKRQLEKLAKNAFTVCDTSSPKFDAFVEYNSNAAEYIKNEASRVAEVYRRNSVVVQNPLDTIEIGEVYISGDAVDFDNGVHPQYSDFNDLELLFARELDKTGYYWMRNPKNGFLKIRLLDGQGTETFSPDFIVWKENEILALDTKGDHLILTDSARKLFFIDKVCEGRDLTIKLISEKQYNDQKQVLSPKGFTVWTVKQGVISPLICSTMSEAVFFCIT